MQFFERRGFVINSISSQSPAANRSCQSISLQLNTFRFTYFLFQTAFESPTDMVSDYTIDNI